MLCPRTVPAQSCLSCLVPSSPIQCLPLPPIFSLTPPAPLVRRATHPLKRAARSSDPTGLTLSLQDYTRLAELCHSHGVVLFSDEMYRGLEHTAERAPLTAAAVARGSPGGTNHATGAEVAGSRLPSACELSPSAVSLEGMSKVLAMPGLRIGWLATRNTALLSRVGELKDYTTICSSAPSEILALIGLRNRDAIVRRNMAVVDHGLSAVTTFMARYRRYFAWTQPAGATIAFPRLRRLEELCRGIRRLKEETKKISFI